MAEYIDKAKVEWFKCKGIAHFEGDEEREFILIDVKHIDELPTIDIVTCKECKYSNVDKMGWYCNRYYHGVTDENTDFCSDGERRSDE